MFPFVLNQYTPPRFFLRDHNGNKVSKLFCVIPATAPYHNLVCIVLVSFLYDVISVSFYDLVPFIYVETVSKWPAEECYFKQSYELTVCCTYHVTYAFQSESTLCYDQFG